MAAPQEIYVRNESETEARGPFNLEQLTALAANAQVAPATLYYEPATEQWLALSLNPELAAALFPQKVKLQMRTTEKFKSLNETAAGGPAPKPITVDDMLAAAEGRTPETKDKADPQIAMARASAVGRWSSVGLLGVSAAGELLPAMDALVALDLDQLVSHPLALLGLVDLVLAVLIGLGTVGLYPFVRFRAALGFGLLGMIFYLQGDPGLVFYALIGSVGLYLCTVLVYMLPILIASAVLGAVGMVTIMMHFLSR